jgi:hypothetical protein
VETKHKLLFSPRDCEPASGSSSTHTKNIFLEQKAKYDKAMHLGAMHSKLHATALAVEAILTMTQQSNWPWGPSELIPAECILLSLPA